MYEKITLSVDTARSALSSPDTRLTCRRRDACRRDENAILEHDVRVAHVSRKTATYCVEVFIQFRAKLSDNFRELIRYFDSHRFQLIERTRLSGHQCYDQWSQ